MWSLVSSFSSNPPVIILAVMDAYQSVRLRIYKWCHSKKITTKCYIFSESSWNSLQDVAHRFEQNVKSSDILGLQFYCSLCLLPTITVKSKYWWSSDMFSDSEFYPLSIELLFNKFWSRFFLGPNFGCLEKGFLKITHLHKFVCALNVRRCIWFKKNFEFKRALTKFLTIWSFQTKSIAYN